jgi:hypothetical protein
MGSTHLVSTPACRRGTEGVLQGHVADPCSLQLLLKRLKAYSSRAEYFSC